ncbi:MFS transporter [Paenibacillus glycanilyticus]|uniref:MFS transporter n=1 Tax=Paenibacillus glycanilyticus TaxID=126569 RepID=UPI00295F049F|nr:MFS transporter [Paenibacillus glycanilyticus]
MKRSFIISLLSLSLAANLAPMLAAPAVKLLAVEFPDTSLTFIQLIVTLSSLFILPTLTIVGFLSKKFAKKDLLIFGLILYLIGGVIPAFLNDVTWILVFRAILGLGIGFIIPIQNTIVAEYFEGNDRFRFNGYISSVSGIGGAVFISLGGILATLGWRGVFFTYSYALIILILVILYIPRLKPVRTESVKKDAKTITLPMRTLLYGFASAGLLILYYTVPTNLAIFITDNQFGDSSVVGYVTALSLLAVFIAGIMLTSLKLWFKKALVPVILLFFAGSYLLLHEAQSIWLVAVSVFIIGFANGAIFPILINKTSESVPLDRVTSAMSVLFGLTFIGQFSSPLVMNSIKKIFNFDSLRDTFLFMGVMLLLSAIISLLMVMKPKLKPADQAKGRSV